MQGIEQTLILQELSAIMRLGQIYTGNTGQQVIPRSIILSWVIELQQTTHFVMKNKHLFTFKSVQQATKHISQINRYL